MVAFSTSSRSNGMVTFCRQDGTRGKMTSEEAVTELNRLTEAGFRLVNSYGKKVQCRCSFSVDNTSGVTLQVDGNISLNSSHIGWDVSYTTSGTCLEKAVDAFYDAFNADFLGKVTLSNEKGEHLNRASFGVEAPVVHNTNCDFTF
jgi:hypothetical protein